LNPEGWKLTHILQAAQNLESMTSGMGMVLDNFAAYTVSDVDSVVAPDGTEREFYFPGFLTSTRLISLELQVSFPKKYGDAFTREG
jgi:hypothetical protein